MCVWMSAANLYLHLASSSTRIYVHTHPCTQTRKCRHFNGKAVRPAYVGRKPSAATATGLGGRAHTVEQEAICAAAFTSTGYSSAF